jgi:hypothetical protein
MICRNSRSREKRTKAKAVKGRALKMGIAMITMRLRLVMGGNVVVMMVCCVWWYKVSPGIGFFLERKILTERVDLCCVCEGQKTKKTNERKKEG